MPSPSVSPPPPDVLDRILGDNASRFPEKAAIGGLLGDGGARVTLPIILANPRDGSPAFNEGIAVALNFRPNQDPTGEELVKECLLWPPRTVWNDWRARWAAIDGRVVLALGRKLGSTLAVLSAPESDAALPEGIAPSPAGVCRIFTPAGAPKPIYVAIEPPDDAVWRMFVNAATKPDAEVFKISRDLALGCIKASTMPAEAMFDRWPGLVVATVSVLAELAGTGAEVELGNW
jgi:hypothetical protein